VASLTLASASCGEFCICVYASIYKIKVKCFYLQQFCVKMNYPGLTPQGIFFRLQQVAILHSSGAETHSIPALTGWGICVE
jgi:hypothetical protein